MQKQQAPKRRDKSLLNINEQETRTLGPLLPPDAFLPVLLGFSVFAALEPRVFIPEASGLSDSAARFVPLERPTSVQHIMIKENVVANQP